MGRQSQWGSSDWASGGRWSGGGITRCEILCWGTIMTGQEISLTWRSLCEQTNSMGRECCGLVVQPWYRWPACCYKSPSTNPSQTCQIVSLTLREARNHNPAHRAGGGVRRWAVGRLEYVGLLSEFMLHCVHSSLLSSSYTIHHNI